MTNLLTAIAGPARADGRARSSFDDRAPRAGSVCTAVALQPLIQPSGPGNSSPVDVVLLLSLLMTAMWAATNGLRVRVPYAVPVALLVVAGAVAGLLGALPPVALLAVVQDIVLLGWCTALVNLGAVAGALRLITRTWALSSVCWAGVLVAAWLLHVTPVLGITAAGGNRVMFTFGDPNYPGTYRVSSLFVVVAVQTPNRAGFRRIGYVLLLAALLLNESNGGVVQLLAGLGLLAATSLYRRRGVFAAAAFVSEPLWSRSRSTSTRGRERRNSCSVSASTRTRRRPTTTTWPRSSSGDPSACSALWRSSSVPASERPLSSEGPRTSHSSPTSPDRKALIAALAPWRSREPSTR